MRHDIVGYPRLLLIHPHPRYRLGALLAECDPLAEPTTEDQRWLDNGPVGNEFL
uniref:Antitoxin ChpS n=1 Tax=Candidatus Kentrum sp. FW TaxID=2126338 RepID=A0A450SXV1_9GAMM|nr:MAG: antitoxin ChpS [Candidatus Kentron sp. FW]